MKQSDMDSAGLEQKPRRATKPPASMALRRLELQRARVSLIKSCRIHRLRSTCGSVNDIWAPVGGVHGKDRQEVHKKTALTHPYIPSERELHKRVCFSKTVTVVQAA
jgi:hypothetical protein